MVHNAGRWCTMQVGGAQRTCTIEIVQNVSLTDPERLMDRQMLQNLLSPCFVVDSRMLNKNTAF